MQSHARHSRRPRHLANEARGSSVNFTRVDSLQPLNMMAWPRAHLLPLLAAALTTLLASIATAQQFDPETLPQGTWTNKVAGSFASGLAGWTCSGGEAAAATTARRG